MTNHRGRKLFAYSFPSGMGRLRIYRDRKLFANGFLLDVGQWGFIETGNCLRMVSYSTWDKGDSSRQETVCEWFPTRRGKWGFIATGNCLRWVPIRRGAVVYHSGRKLFANGFLSGMRRWCITSTGNYLHDFFLVIYNMSKQQREGRTKWKNYILLRIIWRLRRRKLWRPWQGLRAGNSPATGLM